MSAENQTIQTPINPINPNETTILNAVLEDTLQQLELAKQVALDDTLHLDQIDREIIQSDYKTAISLFASLKSEITTKSSFKSLQQFLEKNQATRNDLLQAEQKSKEIHHDLHVLQDKIAREESENNKEAQVLNIQLGLLKDQHQDQLLENNIKCKYSSNWLKAQSKQHEFHLKNNECNLEKQVERLETHLEEEHRVHDELEDFYSMKLGEYIQQLVYWVDKYEKDKNDYDANIATIKREHEMLLTKISNAKQQYASRQAEITAYEEIKENRRLEEIRLAHLNANATKIQAWWKGMMVRCKLGPYKVKKPKGKAKNKKK